MGKRGQWLNFGMRAALCASAVWIGTGFAAESYGTWSHSADLLLDTSPAGADVNTNVTGFPVLLRLTSANFIFSEAKGHGQDLRFAKANGAPLDYQIDRWDSSKSVAEIWIKADTVYGNQAGQIIHVYWGNPSAADSSNGNATFNQGFTQVWHLGDAGTVARPNSVAGGLAAAPVNYEGDESRPGIIGMSDSLDGGSPGDYLDIGDGYTEYAGGFTYSVWVYPTAVKKWAHILDLGNGEFGENIILNRINTSDSMALHNYNAAATGKAPGLMQAANGWVLNQWQYLTLTISGTSAKLYKNGGVIASATLINTVSSANRTANFLGKSNWAVDDYYQGKLDEPELAKVARSDAWVKLCYQNQKSAQNLVTVKLPDRCKARFSVPADTTVNEGSTLVLSSTADCATGFSWSALSGPAPRILDPETKALTVNLPRVAGDTVVVYRFAAAYADSSPYKDVKVHIKESIPEPAFTFPAVLTWNGKDAVPFRPSVSNLAAIKASRDSVLSWNWTLTGTAADTLWLKDGLMLRSSPEGKMQVGLCLSNGWLPTCKTATMTVSATAALSAVKRLRAARAAWLSDRDAMGRRTEGTGEVTPGFQPPLLR